MTSGLDINGSVLSYFEGTANVHFYTSCTLTTLHCSKVSFLQFCQMKIYNKIFTKCEGCTHFCEILCISVYIYIYIYIYRERERERESLCMRFYCVKIYNTYCAYIHCILEMIYTQWQFSHVFVCFVLFLAFQHNSMRS